ncbi:hypothetical protein [Thiothrix eikelboomii]|uniref:hypothetical protein n=1 Tax=Thiothrix eikelboomii TaxID=92487 RepID=UPI003BB03A0F
MNTSGMGYKILDERYALLECLAVSGIGEIYRGRDLELAQTETRPSRILIHLLPQHDQLRDLEANLAQAQTITQDLNQPWVLPILAQGQTEGRPYFVLSSPDSLGAHSVMSLPSQQLPDLNKLTQQFGSLVKAKQLPNLIDSALLISLPNQSLYLLATAFLQPIHALRAYHTGLTIYKRPTVTRSLALSSMMAITLSTFAVEYQNKPDTLSLQDLQAKPVHVSSPQTVFHPLTGLTQAEQASLHDRPTTSHPLNSTLPFALQEPLAALEPALVALSSTSIQTTTRQPVQQTKLAATTLAPLSLDNITKKTAAKIPDKASETTTEKAAEKKKTTGKPNLETSKEQPSLAATKTKPAANLSLKPLPAKPTAKAAVVTQPETSITKVTTEASNQAIYYTASIDTSDTVDASTQLTKSSPLTPPKPSTTAAKAPPLSLANLIERANKTLDMENFSEKNGVVFYLRQIKLRDPLHPQIERLGRFVVMYQHEIVRNKLKADATVHAQALLTLSKSLIQEFNLKSLNSAQQVLEHKSNQYSLAK